MKYGVYSIRMARMELSQQPLQDLRIPRIKQEIVCKLVTARELISSSSSSPRVVRRMLREANWRIRHFHLDSSELHKQAREIYNGHTNDSGRAEEPHSLPPLPPQGTIFQY